MTAFRLVVPIAELHSSNHRGHWSVGARKRAAMRRAAKATCAGFAPMTGPVTLTVTFAFPDRRRRDLDNVEIKGAIDGAVDAGLLPDDRLTVLCGVNRIPADEPSPKGYAVLTFQFAPVTKEST